MRLTIDGDAWNQGFRDGEAGQPLRSCPYAVGTSERLSWSSGYIEGKAARDGFKATRPCSPRKRGEAAGAEPSAAPLRVAAPVSAPAAQIGIRATAPDQSPVENRLAKGVKIARRSGVKVRRRLTNRLMQMEVEGLTGAAHGERSPERTNHRNGYRHRDWETRVGTIDLAIPKLRKGNYHPAFLEPRRTAEKALTAVIQEAYVHGVSTRSVDDLVKAMGMTGISKSQVSRLCAEIDERVHSFLNRPLEGSWPYLWIDATYVKVRQAGRIVSVAAIIAVAVNTDGRREVLGLEVGPSEAEPFWTGFLRSLTRRGLRGVKLVISDSHEGLKKAASKVLSSTWQRCRVHFMRNALAHVGTKQRAMVAAAIRTAFTQETQVAACEEWRAVADRLRERFPKLGALMDEAEHDVLAHLAFPKEHWPQLHSTNPLERLNGEIKRRTNVVQIFPNEAAIVRLVGALLLEQNDEWAASRARYMSLEKLAQFSDDPQAGPKRIAAA